MLLFEMYPLFTRDLSLTVRPVWYLVTPWTGPKQEKAEASVPEVGGPGPWTCFLVSLDFPYKTRAQG